MIDRPPKVLPAFFKPSRKSLGAKIALRADQGNARSAQRREDETYIDFVS
jgi:hypothetical protein